MFSQEKTGKEMPEYYRKEEILHEGKRYRLHNGYLTIGGGYVASAIHADQRNVGFDIHIPLYKNTHLQAGAMMNGPYFLGNNNTQLHLGYGLRKETAKTHFAGYGGLSFFNGVIGRSDTAGIPFPEYYSGGGIYFCAQAVTKLSYDIGIGLEGFIELGKYQQVPSTSNWYDGAPIFSKSGNFSQVAGIRLIAFFSSAYRGVKRNYNPNVRTEYGK
ncbi:MAG: hypothetical protein K0S32_1434 [Bacteroidetes bacterium]|jgi:hypothetical protein|nr:hypothetical protein [Bacteroidota bacterium]